MKYKSSKRKKPRKAKPRGSWLQVSAALLAGIGAFLAGLAELLKVIFKLAD